MNGSDKVEYRINPSGFYALYRALGSNSPWRESASITNKQIEQEYINTGKVTNTS